MFEQSLQLILQILILSNNLIVCNCQFFNPFLLIFNQMLLRACFFEELSDASRWDHTDLCHPLKSVLFQGNVAVLDKILLGLALDVLDNITPVDGEAIFFSFGERASDPLIPTAHLFIDQWSVYALFHVNDTETFLP